MLKSRFLILLIGTVLVLFSCITSTNLGVGGYVVIENVDPDEGVIIFFTDIPRTTFVAIENYQEYSKQGVKSHETNLLRNGVPYIRPDEYVAYRLPVSDNEQQFYCFYSGTKQVQETVAGKTITKNVTAWNQFYINVPVQQGIRYYMISDDGIIKELSEIEGNELREKMSYSRSLLNIFFAKTSRQRGLVDTR